jgi:HK97 family phage prohead protease
MIKFTAVPVTLDAAAGEDAPRTITGIAVPWDTVATVSGGEKVMFKRGAFDLNAKPARLLENHDGRPIGIVSELVDLDNGLGFSATFARSKAADDVVELIQMSAYDSVSVGAVPKKFKYDKNGVMIVSSATLSELSVVAVPAYADAIIEQIAASEPDPEVEEEATEPQPDTSLQEETMSTETQVEASAPDAIPTSPIFASAKAEFKMPSAGEWIAAQFAGGSVAAEFNARLRAAAPSVTTADLDGLMPTPILPEIYSGIQGLRPVVDAIGVRAMPQGGKIFIVPKITTHTSIGGPETQNTTITAGQFIVDDIQITKEIYGGYVQLSEASIDWSDPEVLGALLEDLGKKYALFTDNVAADALLAGTSQTTGNVAPTDPGDWVQKVYACANTILANGNYLPDHLFVSGDVFAQLGSLDDTSGRPLFPQVGPMNAFGTMNPGSRDATVFGLRLVVDTNFAAKTTIVGAAATGAFRCYEQQKGAIVADIGAGASTLSRNVAWRGYFAPKMIDANQFMKIPQA